MVDEDINVLSVCLVGGSQNLERRNLERPIFRNFKIPNIKISIIQ